MHTYSELVLVRHGEAHCNRDQTIHGLRTCQGLTPRGRDQVRQLAHRLHQELAERPFDVLYASPIRRAHETAALLSSALHLSPRVEHDLSEPDYGAAEGRTWREALDDFGGIPAAEPDRPVAPDAETWRRYLDRAKNALRGILDRHPGEKILIVGHGETIVAAAALFLHLPAEHRQYVHFAAAPASVTRWRQQPLAELVPTGRTRWVLLTHNERSRPV